MTIKTTFAVLATATAITGWASTPARAEIKTLGECYDAVLTWCNANFPEMDCSNSSGLEQCDEVFGSQANAGLVFQLILPKRGGGRTVHMILPAVQAAREARDSERDPRPGHRPPRGGVELADVGEATPLDPPSRPKPTPKPQVPSPADSISLSPKVP